ncbi:MAG: hypothetical protein ABEJ23_10095 [Haloarculaceae archaeon]
MASDQVAGTTDLVSVERTLDARSDGVVSTLTFRAREAPLVVRFADAVGDWSGADSVRMRDEPARWTVEGATLLAELLVSPDGPATVTYELRGVDPDADPDSVVVEQAQPIDEAALSAGEVPQFRDTQTFDSQDANVRLPTDGEATDADVRAAVEAVAAPRKDPTADLETATETFDLADPPGDDADDDR